MSVASLSWQTKTAYLRICPEKRKTKTIISLWAEHKECSGPTYSKLSDIRGLVCEKLTFRKLGRAAEIATLKENRV